MPDARAASPAVAAAPAAVPSGFAPGLRGRRTLLRRVREKPMMVGGIVVVAGWILLAALAPLIAPYDPIDQDVRHRLGAPSPEHWLGVDELGRDVLSRVLYGGRVSLPVAGAVVAVATVFGTVFGGVAGFAGQWLDGVAMRLVDIVLAFPSLILAMAIAAALGPSIQNSMLAMLLVWWPPYARLARGQVLSLKTREYVMAARGLGLSEPWILLRHILPNAFAPLLVMMTMDFGTAIIITAALSFLGLGAVPPTPEWGAMVAEGRELIQQWWISTFPGVAIFMMAMAANFIGDGLRDIIDPRLRSR
jgi:peptide/nickel transport system permease protein